MLQYVPGYQMKIFISRSMYKWRVLYGNAVIEEKMR